MFKGEYTQLATPEGMEPCPCCGAEAQMWQYVNEREVAQKVGMCSNGEAFGPQEDDGLVNMGCPLFMATIGHHQPTIREALKYWNEYAKALTALQRKNRWETHQAMREGQTP